MIASLCLSLAPTVVGPVLPQEAAAPASASALTYTYGQFDFIRGDGDGYGDGPDGYVLHGSFALQDKLFLFGGLEHVNGDIGNTDKDVNLLSIGLGYHSPINPQTDLVLGASLSHANSESGTPNSSADGTGFILQGGVRHAATDKWELDGTIGYTDYNDSSSNVWLELGAVYRMTANLGVCGALMVSDDLDTLSLGLRYQP